MRHSIAVAERAWLVAQREAHEGVYIRPSEMKLLETNSVHTGFSFEYTRLRAELLQGGLWGGCGGAKLQNYTGI